MAEPTVASLLFATMHGLMAIQSIGGMHPEKGLNGKESSLRILLELISPKKPDQYR